MKELLMPLDLHRGHGQRVLLAPQTHKLPLANLYRNVLLGPGSPWCLMVGFSGSGCPGQAAAALSPAKLNPLLKDLSAAPIFPSSEGTFTKVLLALLVLLSSGVMESTVLLSILLLSTCKNYCAYKIVLSRPWNITGWFEKKKEYVQVRDGWLQAGNQSFFLIINERCHPG